MSYTQQDIQNFLADLPAFQELPSTTITALANEFQFLRYGIGQAILVPEYLPTHVSILYQGQARLIGYEPGTGETISLRLLKAGEICGWVGILRGIACETVIASTEVVVLTLPTDKFAALLNKNPSFAAFFQTQPHIIEVFNFLGETLEQQANSAATLKKLGVSSLKELVLKDWSEAIVYTLSSGKHSIKQFGSERVWFVSSGTVAHHPVGTIIDTTAQAQIEVQGSTTARFIGLNRLNAFEDRQPAQAKRSSNLSLESIPYAPEQAFPVKRVEPAQAKTTQKGKGGKYSHFKGRGPLDASLACFRMLSQYFNTPFRKDVISRILTNQLNTTGKLSIQLCGAVAELMGLNAQLLQVPAAAISRLQAPAMIAWQDSFAIIYEISDRELVIAVPETGIHHVKPAAFIQAWGQQGEVLLLKATKDTPQQKFGLSWFLPALRGHRRVLIEVLIASLFVQIFALANPLMTQVVIDKVLVQNSIGTLNVLGIFLLIVAIFEAVLTSLRTNLFVDTTNRIDLALGSQLIDHLLRLPLSYFEKRPVGELATRINELENIRQFLTGTALTVVLDAIFSVVYIIVMLLYSWLLTLVALATLPLFIALTMGVAPVVQRQLRTKAERNAETQSYLVEVLSGIQTVKAQNIELRSRWRWQERYARYVSAGFKTVLTSTTAGSISNFLNKLSSLLLLWIGAYLVLNGQLSLGQLIAFRIIAGYTTSPLLRLVQLWQNFQETALSLERLADILDAPQETDELNRLNIPMPMIEGAVRYEDVTFKFPNSLAPQLRNINVEFPSGVFVGIVGQSGSGKSTLMKLLARLYDPDSGRILVDDYDITKVELHSLRRQIGMVLQDTLLFQGTVQENITLNHPDATSDEIIRAAKIAAAHDFIMSLPKGYNSNVGERGSALSGGQRQRIAIARTVLQNPHLLILDEATSALDYDSERQVCLNLAEAFRGRTVFFITHRLSTIKNADVILMMDKGLVVEQGTHPELMDMKGRYYYLYQQQESQS